jgi:OOP family OmpA-OmpF porin
VRLAAFALLCLAAPAAALTLDLPPAAERVRAEVEPYGSVRLPVTAWQTGGPQTVWAEGAVTREAWQIPAGALTTLQILAPLRDQILAAGFDVMFECRDRGCGGFDFRYALDLLPEPDMHVDLGDFRWLAAEHAGGTRPEYVALMVSRAGERGFVQVIRVTPADPQPLPPPAAVPAETAAAPAEAQAIGPQDAPAAIAAALAATGRAPLDDLTFATGSARLDAAPFASLAALAAWMADNPEARIVLVGHTDTEGALVNNIALSRARADAVRARLVENHGIAAARLSAEGVGFLAPRASNATPEGRTLNRRVEAVLASPG